LLLYYSPFFNDKHADVELISVLKAKDWNRNNNSSIKIC